VKGCILLQFLPRSASERAPICMYSFLLRSATCMMVSAEAELIAPHQHSDAILIQHALRLGSGGWRD